MKKFFLTLFIVIFLAGTVAPALALAKTSNDPKGKQHWSFKDIGAYEAWDITTGSRDVIVAVIDNGFDATHPDLKDNVWKNEDEISNNKVDDDNNGYIDDVWGWNFVGSDQNGDGKLKGDELQGDNNPIPDVSHLTKSQKDDGFYNHGTIVAGLIGAVGNNKTDMAGLNWNIRLMNLKVLSNIGEGRETGLTEAIYYAIDNGAHIINISAVGGNSKNLKNAIDAAYEKGIVVVAAAGNNAESLKTSPLYPACSDAGSKVQKVLGVSAIEESHRLASFSNYGSNCVDITAPGVNIGSLVRYDPDEGLRTSYSDGWDGTSFSTPLVTGAAALIKAVQPEWKAPQIYDALLKNTHRTPPANDEAYKNMYGSGLLQVDKAVEYALKQRVDFTLLQGIGLVDTTSGSFVEITKDKKITSSSYSFLQKITGFAAYKEDGKTWYATIRPILGKNRVTIYFAQWQKIKHFDVPLTIQGTMYAGQFSSDETEILFAPLSKSQPFTLYSLDGKKVGEMSLDVPGSMVSVQILSSVGSNKKDIGVVSKEGTKYILTIFDGNFKKETSLTLPGVGKVSTVSRGDIDADGKVEYIVLSQKGPSATVSIVDTQGKRREQFPLSNTVSAGDFQFILGDFTGDKKDDIITLEKNTDKLVIWKKSGEMLQSVKFPRSSNQFFALLAL